MFVIHIVTYTDPWECVHACWRLTINVQWQLPLGKWRAYFCCVPKIQSVTPKPRDTQIHIMIAAERCSFVIMCYDVQQLQALHADQGYFHQTNLLQRVSDD